MQGWLFKDVYFAWSDSIAMLANSPLKLNNVVNTYLISASINLMDIIIFH